MKTFHHGEFADAAALARQKRGRTISVCVPTLNEEDTIGDVVRALAGGLEGFADEIAVVDSGSEDRTREVAAAAGARVFLAADVLPEAGPARGKGENIWKSLACLQGDLLCFVDGDVTNMHPRFVLGTVGPLLADPGLQYVKGFYERPHAAAGVGSRPAGGGRVTEALVRPLFALFYPPLASLVQPLSGEYAVRRAVLEGIPMPTGYGVETAHLIDILEGWGAEAIGQTDLDERQHRHQDTASLGRMSFAILHAMLPRARASGRMQLAGDPARVYRHFLREEGVCREVAWELPDFERPPMREFLAGGGGRCV